MRHLFPVLVGGLLLSSVPITTVMAQTRSISGQVLDANGKPVVGATVVEKGTNNGISTNGEGRFVLRARTASPRLVISAISFQTQEVEGGDNVAVKLAETETSLDAVQVVGSRAQNRSVTDSPSPVDLIDVREVTAKTGQLDVNQLLQFVAPSFNSNRQTGSDGADHVDPATLRGLGPDQTLVLVNGKRWHQSSLVNLFGSRGRGNSGYDLNTIPAASIERIEILRDGAAAQYGSDAIAGVINIVLKKSTGEATANVNYGAYSAKYRNDDKKFDGGNLNANVNYGVGFGKGGFVNATVDFNQRDHTQRANVPAPDGLARREYGDPKITNTALYLNAGLPISDKTSLYAFGGANKRKGDAYAWTRFADDNRNVPEIYPNGFDPIITSDIVDYHAVGGLRTKLGNWDLDLSNGFGSNRFEYGVKNTLNVSLGPQSPTKFEAGGFQLQQNVANLTLTKNYKTILSGVNVAVGGEWRREWYSLFAGEEKSYKNYDPAGTPDSLLRAFGSQGFPGFRPNDVTKNSRDNLAGFLDLEFNLTPRWLVAGAVRFENYSDFGSTFNYKGATRFNVTDFLTLRGTYSTGFRAPSLAQVNFQSTFTNFEEGLPVEVHLARNGSPIARAAGIPDLKQETSRNASLGFTSRIGGGFSLTVDGYYINVKDRVVLTDYFRADDSTLSIAPVIRQMQVDKAQFFANAISTTTKGVDVVLSHSAQLGDGRLNTSIAANFNELKIDKVHASDSLKGREDQVFGPREQMFVKASAPRSKVNLTFNYQLGRWGMLLRFVRFDKVDLPDWDGNPLTYDARITTDLALSYSFTNHLMLTLGSSNLFDKYPTLQNPQLTETGGAWDPVQMGSNGRFLFAKLQARF